MKNYTSELYFSTPFTKYKWEGWEISFNIEVQLYVQNLSICLNVITLVTLYIELPIRQGPERFNKLTLLV